ncbi:site-specific integrase [Halopolyspora algeriensis]|uniref:site-specific integrase n=1 Tax=Halopolyspora algeriensis TaxID=1500506 RepID=UPI001314099F|nr:site-specific integrase [Halopolyspora algeriensis]
MDGKRKTMRRSGFSGPKAAKRELNKVLDRDKRNIRQDDRQTVADYLAGWLDGKQRILKPTTYLNYERYVRLDIVPALGAIKVERLHHDHVREFVGELESAGRGAVTIRRIMATLSSALKDGVDRRRLEFNAAAGVELPPVERSERQPWTAEQAVTFLDHAAEDRLGPLFEVLMGCGLRRGEALALRWQDVDIEGRVLHVRRTLSSVGGHLKVTVPKTKGSKAGVGLSGRVVDALKAQSARQAVERAEWAEAYEDDDLVFSRENGAPLRPEYVLKRFREISREAGLPEVRLHDLRHMAATLMLASGIPLSVVSKTLRHAQVGITADLYGHHSRETAHAAADAMGGALDAAAAERRNETAAREVLKADATTMRPQGADTGSAAITSETPNGARTAKNPQRTGGSKLSRPDVRP